MNKKIFIIGVLVIIIIGIFIFFRIKLNEEKETKIISYYNNPIIPKGFHTVDTETAKWTKKENGSIKDWNKGLVIEDENGNQFVWIPVKKEDLSYEIKEIEEEFKYKLEEFNTSNAEEEQIIKYGGFYISRYEAGVQLEMQSRLTAISSKTNDISGMPVSKKGIIPWNYISFKNAKQNAESMYNNNYYSSHLPTLKQMMYITSWLNKSAYNVYNSSDFGNYSNVNFKFSGYYSDDYGKNYKFADNKIKGEKNMILSTGATDRNMTNNIYDLAGNLWEYTNDYCAINENEILGYYCVGGHYDNTGDNYPIYSHNLKNVEPLDKVGFRIVLSLNSYNFS